MADKQPVEDTEDTEDTEAAEPLPIHVVIPRVMRSIGAVGKDDFNSFMKFNFRGIDSVVNAVYPALVRHGVFIAPEVIDADYAEVETSKGKDSRQATITVRYRVYGPAGDHIEAVVTGEAMDAGDKATSKALSMAFKYLLFELFCIPVEEGKGHDDADKESHERAGRSRPETKPATSEPLKPTKKQLQKARIQLGELGIVHIDEDTGEMDEVIYRAAMQQMYGDGTNSISKLTRPQISKLIDSLERGTETKTPEEVAAAIIAKGVQWLEETGQDVPDWARGGDDD